MRIFQTGNLRFLEETVRCGRGQRPVTYNQHPVIGGFSQEPGMSFYVHTNIVNVLSDYTIPGKPQKVDKQAADKFVDINEDQLPIGRL